MSQTQLVTGTITDNQGEPLSGASIFTQDTKKGGMTDFDGLYSLELEKGSYTLVVKYIGYKTSSTKIKVNNKPVSLNIILKSDVTQLKDVEVIGKSKTTVKRQEPYAVTVIDAKPLKIQNLNINQILNTTSGVRIREEGGMGSNFNFSLNGFSGNQVKFFIDGIPMDYFGSSLSLNNIPVNLISSIEVYKGVVPVNLGSDALGGAVNVITNSTMKDFLDVSYSGGSFNTHKASIISRVTTKKGLIFNANAFINYSDNDYKVEVEIPDPDSGKLGAPEKVRRFHDIYRSQTIQFEAGIKNKAYADKLFIGLIGSQNYKEIQSGSNMTKVVGEAFTSDKVLIPTLKYLKKDLFTTGLTARVNATYNIREARVTDTVSKIYDWRGDYEYRGIDVRSGEINYDKTLFRFDDKALTTSVNLGYEINDQHSISLNNTYSRYVRIGEDPISYNAVPFSEPNILKKNITGLSYNVNFFKAKLKTNIFGKLFNYNALTKEGNTYNGIKDLTTIEVSDVYKGYGIAATYFFDTNIQLKASYENTYRLPEARELFGDGLLLESNPYLEPENSSNYNLGFLIRKNLGKHDITVETGYLYRLPTNLIRSKTTGVLSVYENLSSVKSNIYEGGIKYIYNNFINFEVNATYQNILNNQKTTATGGENFLYEDRIPNTPFLFGNATSGVILDNIGANSNKLSFNWSTLFVEAFYLNWPSQGSKDSKYDIPRQVSHTASLSYAIKDGKYNIAISCSNLLDSKLFDNFMLQKPGRAFNIKLNYFIN